MKCSDLQVGSCVHIKPIFSPGHVGMERKPPSPLNWQNTYFPKHTTVTTCSTEAWKTGPHHPLWLHVLLYHHQLVFLCRARRFKDCPYSSLPFLLPAEPANPKAEALGMWETQPKWVILLWRKQLLKWLLYSWIFSYEKIFCSCSPS